MPFIPDEIKPTAGFVPDEIGGANPNLNNEVISSNSPTKRTISDVIHNTLPFVTMMGGGAVGSALSPVGAVAGGTLGYAGGQQMADLIDEYVLGVRGAKPLEKRLQRAGKDIYEGAKIEALGVATGKAVEVGGNMLVRKMAQKEIARNELGKRTNVDLTAGMIKQRKPGVLVESMTEKTISGSGVMTDRMNKINEQIASYKDTILTPRGGAINYEAGIKSQGAIEAREIKWSGLVDDAYKAAFTEMPKGTVVPTPQAETYAAGMAERLAQSRVSRGDMHEVMRKFSEGGGLLKRGTPDKITEEIIPKETFALLNKTITKGKPTKFSPYASNTLEGLDFELKWLTGEISTAHKAGDKFKESVYIKLKKSLMSDIDNFAQQTGGEFYSKYTIAKELHGEGVKGLPGANVFYSSRIKQLAKAEPEKFVPLVFKPRNVQDAIKIKKAVGEATWSDMQAGWMENLFRKDGEIFSPLRFATEWKKYDEPTKAVLTSGNPNLKNQLNDLAELGRILQDYQKIGGNPSGTGQIVATFTQFGGAGVALWFHHPIAAVLAMTSPYALAKLVTSPGYTQMMLKGIKMPANSPEVMRMAARMAGITGVNPERQQGGDENEEEKR